MTNPDDDLSGREVVLWCEAPCHKRPRRVAGFSRVSDGYTQENGEVHHAPYLWLYDNAAEYGRWGPKDPVSGLHRGYDPREIQDVSRAGLSLHCPQCLHRRPLTWENLHSILDKCAHGGVSRLTLQQLARILR